MTLPARSDAHAARPTLPASVKIPVTHASDAPSANPANAVHGNRRAHRFGIAALPEPDALLGLAPLPATGVPSVATGAGPHARAARGSARTMITGRAAGNADRRSRKRGGSDSEVGVGVSVALEGGAGGTDDPRT